MATPSLHKTTIVIWSEFELKEDEVDNIEEWLLDKQLYPIIKKTEKIDNPIKDPDSPGSAFFNFDGN